jgi:hypothetical protein
MESERIANLPPEEKLLLADQEVSACSEAIISIQKQIQDFVASNHITIEMLVTGRTDLTGPLTVGHPERVTHWEQQGKQLVADLYQAEQAFHLACSRWAGLKDEVCA